jgi:hypothetical protein
MARHPDGYDAHGRHKTHPRYNEPDDSRGMEGGKVVPDRQRLGLGGSSGYLDEHELPIGYRPTAGDREQPMAIAFTNNKVGPHIVADTTVVKMFSRACHAMDPAVLATMTPLESQTMTTGACSFATAVDGIKYLFVIGTGATARTVILGIATANELAANATGTGANPQTRATARKANTVGSGQIVQT